VKVGWLLFIIVTVLVIWVWGLIGIVVVVVLDIVVYLATYQSPSGFLPKNYTPYQPAEDENEMVVMVCPNCRRIYPHFSPDGLSMISCTHDFYSLQEIVVSPEIFQRFGKYLEIVTKAHPY